MSLSPSIIYPPVKDTLPWHAGLVVARAWSSWSHELTPRQIVLHILRQITSQFTDKGVSDKLVMRRCLTLSDEKTRAAGYTTAGSGVSEVDAPWCLQPVD